MGVIFCESAVLFARPSFSEGLSRIFDLGGTLNIYNESFSPQAADTLAISSDWCAVGRDISYSIEVFQSEEQQDLVRA